MPDPPSSTHTQRTLGGTAGGHLSNKCRREEDAPSSDGPDPWESSRLSMPTPASSRSSRAPYGFLGTLFTGAARWDGTPNGAGSEGTQTSRSIVQTAPALGKSITVPQGPSGLAQMAAASMGRPGNAGTEAAAPSSKGLLHVLAALKHKVEKLSADINEHDADIEKNTHSINDVLALAKDAKSLAQELSERVDALETVTAQLLDRILAAED
ncbi:hypothetical protein NUW54_g58 [Trametes sanguinea]|uniref:Uncharacterized protein n=1 Tax=Trametes sanguinea TaxID=158606 RepID=A0ACC1QA85_9APHY|nr:hypothetical protein NUW54_g58 [Trametes sanguinea]